MFLQIAFDFTAIPGRRVSDVRNRDIVMLAPEKRRFAVSAANAQRIERATTA